MGQRKDKKPPVPPGDLKRDLGLPAQAKFVGYGVHLPLRDEFLALDRSVGDSQGWGWTPFPNYALHISRYDKASRTASRYGRGAIVVYMFDVGDQYIVAVAD